MTTSRDAHAFTMLCPRKRWLQYEAPNGSGGHGWRRKRLSMSDLTEKWTQAGIRLMLQGADGAVAAAINGYLDEARERGLELEDGVDQESAITEQAALVEGLLCAFHRVRLPLWSRNYDILEVGTKDVTSLSEGVSLKSRNDALVRRRADNKLFVVNWEVVSNVGDWWYGGPEKGIPLLVDTLGIERRIGQQVSGVMVEALIKGARHAIKDHLGTRRETSPLIYGYKASGIPVVYDCKYRRGDWIRFKVWEEDFGAESPVAFWVNWLPDETLEPLFASVTIERNQQHIKSFVTQMVSSELRVHEQRDAVAAGRLLDVAFPQNVQACHDCPMHDLCWTPGVADDPAASGLYIPVNDSVT